MQKNNVIKILILTFILSIFFSIIIVTIEKIEIQNKVDEVKQKIVSNLESKTLSEDNETENVIFQDGSIGIIKIPSIDVNAPIYEGTGKEILKYSVRTF